MAIPDDAIFRALVDGYPEYKVWMFSLTDMWHDVSKTLGHPVRFLDEEPS